MPTRANRLIHSTSPYLLQHAHNPVDWRPWSPEALDQAKAEDKPIFLSIGYSACHWCHVMERESFENEEIARLLNERFICIKVDREERPDLDEIYMSAVQLMTGGGGWPLSVFLTPDLRPFFGGTYFPPDDCSGQPGFRRVLMSVAQIYRDKRHEIEKSADALRAALTQLGASPATGAGPLNHGPIEAAVARLEARFDPDWGGFGAAPKFPQSAALRLLLRESARTGRPEPLRMATLTLDRMACGGLYDHLGGGFHRYSVDRQWQVPHFEKMLYDNALLAVVYLEAYQLTQAPLYRTVVEETLDYVLREMTDPDGGFHSTQDADSEGEEGKYYLWTREEIHRLLDPNDAALFCGYYGVTEGGNFEGSNLLRVPTPLDAFAKKHGARPDALKESLDRARAKLFAARSHRVPPAKDEKVLADWNGLMVTALSRAYQALGAEAYRTAAERAAAFVLSRMSSAGGLHHAYCRGQSHVAANLDDYAFLAEGLLDLYEATFDVKWLREAEGLARVMSVNFWDEEGGGFYFTAPGEGDLIVRTKRVHDGATPSGNSVAAHVLLRLARLTGDAGLTEKAERTLRAFIAYAEQAPLGYAHLLCALDFHLGPVKEVAVCGRPGDAGTKALLAVVRRCYLPNKVVAGLAPDSADAREIAESVPLLASKAARNGRPTAYVCANRTCSAPTSSPEELARILADR